VSNQNRSSEDKHSNPIDVVLNQNQEGEISRPEWIKEGVFDVKADDLVHRPHEASQEHSLDDTHETLTPSCLDENPLIEAVENVMKESE
jgi:hypothetical protein